MMPLLMMNRAETIRLLIMPGNRKIRTTAMIQIRIPIMLRRVPVTERLL